jgi:uncharacterized protein (TIGR03382 family)
VLPTVALVPGHHYELVLPRCSGVVTENVDYVATDPLPLPTSLGALDISPLYAAYVERGRENLEHWVELHLTTDETLLPWARLYGWGLVQDGAYEPVSRGSLRVAIRCNARFDGHSPDPLVLTGYAASGYEGLPTLTTPTLTATLACEDALIVHSGDLSPLTPEEIAFYDMVPEADAGFDAGLDAGAPASGDAAVLPTLRARSVCSASHGASSPSIMALSVALWALARGRRRWARSPW